MIVVQAAMLTLSFQKPIATKAALFSAEGVSALEHQLLQPATMSIVRSM